MPIVTLPRLLFSIASWAILAAAIYLLWTWNQGYAVVDEAGRVTHERGPDWRLYVGLALLAWSFLGRFVILLFMPAGRDEPRDARGPSARVSDPHSSMLNVESFGPEGGPTLVLTHGWGLNATAWWYARRDLAKDFRVLTWDLPGLGRSTGPADGRYEIDRFAQSLCAVLDCAGEGPIVLVGHSIGGMTVQSFWRVAPEATRRRIAGVVLLNTTYQNPLTTMWPRGLWRALQTPLIQPLCWATIALSPLAWLSAWQGYLSGSNQLATRLTAFGRHATRGQVDFAARLACKGSPRVQAKGNLAMFRWRATEVLPTVPVPVLVLAGEKDIVTLAQASHVIAKAAPDARLVQVDGVGHMGFLERPDAYNQAIADFAAAVTGDYAGKVR